MSYELANENGLLGQFASGGGYNDFCAAVTSDYPNLKSLVKNGASDNPSLVVQELDAFIMEETDADIISTATALQKLARHETVIIVTNGALPDD